MDKEKLLITGVAGFIGFHLSKNLLDSGFEIYGIDNINDYYDINLKSDRLNQLKEYPNFHFSKIDISKFDELKEVFEEFLPDKVVNLQLRLV